MSVSPTESCTSSQRHRTVYDDLDLAQRPEDFRNGIVSAVRVASARRYLGATIASRAALKAAQYGVEWEPVTLAPSTLSDMTQTFVACQKSGRPFPVDTSWSSQDLFLTAAQQYAWRFLRAVGQIEEGGGESFPDQLELGLWCLAQLDVTKTPPGSVVWRLLHAETVGRLYVRAISGRTVTDSVTFALASLTLGVDEAIADAVEAFAYDDSAEESPSDSGSPGE